MTFAPQMKIPATFMRGGTSKGVFFRLSDLPVDTQIPGPARDALLLRIIGSPDPYKKQTDGMGGATSSTSKAVIVSASELEQYDVNYLFGQIAIDKPFVDWSGNCGNLTAAVGAFAITNGLVNKDAIPINGLATVRIWQQNIGKGIIVRVPINNGVVQETGNFVLDGVTFPAAEIIVEFLSPADEGALFPTGNLVDTLEIPEIGSVKATMISAGIPTIFVNAADIGYTGRELQSDINDDVNALARLEAIRAYGAVKMGLVSTINEAEVRPHTPKVAFVSPAESYQASSGKMITSSDIDLNVRAVSMGKLHHAMMGTAAVAIAAAATIPGTLVNIAAGGGNKNDIVFGHPSGTLRVGAITTQHQGQWEVKKVMMSRSARILMAGWVFAPKETLTIGSINPDL